ncbi:MAG: hypothetical protein ABIR30_06265 [Chitinophagaceae bacterium]
MKKMILTLAIAISTMTAFAGEEDVNPKALNAFKTEFNSAKEVEWTVGSNYYRATFVYNEKHVFAYYNEIGELLGLTRYLASYDLPISLQTNLKKNYPGYWISDLFEVAKNDGTAYYLTLESADTKLVLKSSNSSNWTVYSKSKKS